MTSQLGQVQCNLQNGMFANEYAVEIELSTGGKISIFADRGLVLTNGSEKSGYLQVQIIKEGRDTSTVLLPSEALETGSRWAEVRKSHLEHIHDPQQHRDCSVA